MATGKVAVDDVLAAMERVVGAATPGPWSRCCRACNVLEHGEDRERLGNTFYNGHKVYAVHDGFFISEEEADANADYIARFDPPTLTALLAVVNAAEAARGWGRDARHEQAEQAWCALTDALDALTRPPQGASNG